MWFGLLSIITFKREYFLILLMLEHWTESFCQHRLETSADFYVANFIVVHLATSRLTRQNFISFHWQILRVTERKYLTILPVPKLTNSFQALSLRTLPSSLRFCFLKKRIQNGFLVSHIYTSPIRLFYSSNEHSSCCCRQSNNEDTARCSIRIIENCLPPLW